MAFHFFVRMVDSTQQFVKYPQSAKFVMPRCRSIKSRLVLANAHSPRLPDTTTSESVSADHYR